MDIKTLVKVTSRAWSLDILASLHAGIPGRQAPLLASTDANRSAFGSSLSHLVELALLERNPGHGHPLRPEYRLTVRGSEMAGIASKIVRLIPEGTDFALLRRTWTVPVLSVTYTPRRFTEIKTDLLSITDRALSQSLDQLQELQWLRREIDLTERPARPTYQAASTGLEICRAVHARQ